MRVLITLFGILLMGNINSIPQQIDTIAATDVSKIVELHKDLIIIDCRDSAQYAQGHIPGAIGMDVRRPLGVEHFLDTLDRDAQYLIYCRTNIRIRTLLQLMQEKGFQKILVMTDGYLVWEEKYGNKDNGCIE